MHVFVQNKIVMDAFVYELFTYSNRFKSNYWISQKLRISAYIYILNLICGDWHVRSFFLHCKAKHQNSFRRAWWEIDERNNLFFHSFIHPSTEKDLPSILVIQFYIHPLKIHSTSIRLYWMEFGWTDIWLNRIGDSWPLPSAGQLT